ncbi:MAG: ribonuclease P protein component [Bacteroidetes bacterium]|nr:ribonuclease P protein component [Bacteroidota bacterium]
MARQFTYGRQERLKSRKRIEQLFREGRSFPLPPFRVYWLLLLPPEESPARKPGNSQRTTNNTGTLPANEQRSTDNASLQAGFGVSTRQFKKAVDRNRVKRLAREAWRLQKQPLDAAMAGRPEQLALFFIYTARELPAFEPVKAKIGEAIGRLLKILHEKAPLHT